MLRILAPLLFATAAGVAAQTPAAVHRAEIPHVEVGLSAGGLPAWASRHIQNARPLSPTSYSRLELVLPGDSTPEHHPSRGVHVAIGVLTGLAVGVVVGLTRASKEEKNCGGPSCEGGPPLEIVIYPTLYGIGGMLLGGAAGWFWPSHRS